MLEMLLQHAHKCTISTHTHMQQNVSNLLHFLYSSLNLALKFFFSPLRVPSCQDLHLVSQCLFFNFLPQFVCFFHIIEAFMLSKHSCGPYLHCCTHCAGRWIYSTNSELLKLGDNTPRLQASFRRQKYACNSIFQNTFIYLKTPLNSASVPFIVNAMLTPSYISLPALRWKLRLSHSCNLLQIRTYTFQTTALMHPF